MGKTVDSKLQQAEELEAKAEKLKTKDPTASQQIKDYAHKVRASAIRQMKRRPRRGRGTGSVRTAGEGKDIDLGL